MKVLGVVGPRDAGRPDLVERLADRLSTHGRVATVHDRAGGGPGGDDQFANGGREVTDHPGSGTAVGGESGAAITYGLDDGSWTATGEGRTLWDVLDRLAPAVDYALLEGFDDAGFPGIALAGHDHDGETVATAAHADDVDTDELVEALRDVDPHETLESLVARVKESPDAERAGAIATFTGRVRAKDGEDDPRTEFLEFEAYDGLAAQRMDDLEADLETRDGVLEVLLHHRTGRIDYPEDIVFVVVLAGHRGEAFRTVEDGINRLKEEVPLFKREVTVEEEFWVHERE